MTLTMNLGNALGLLGVAFCFASFVMKRMVSLRVLALASNLCFIAYGLIEGLLPSIVLNAALLPVNARRLWEITKLSKEIARATLESPVSQWLLPHMQRRAFRTGEVLFRRGEPADKLVYVATGQLRLPEISRQIGAGELIGEIGLFSRDKIRTHTVLCETDGELYEMTDEMIFQLYYQNPSLGFYLIRLLAERLLGDVHRREAQAAVA
jgi:CRP/FNR family transcriptional regulator, cyclic AMP receptor protein